MDKINLDALRKILADRNGTEAYVIAEALLAIAEELREMNQRAKIGIDPEFQINMPSADEVLGRWHGA